MNRWVAGLCLVLLSVSAPADANTGFTLYHVTDQANIDHMFVYGLAGNGGDSNPIHHANGTSCAAEATQARRSAYLSLTSTEDVAQAAVRASPGAMQFWVLRIRPDRDAPPRNAVYDVARGLGGLLADDPSMYLRRRVAVQRLFNAVAIQETYITRALRGTSIEAADLYVRNAVTQRLEFVRTQVNPRFVLPVNVGTQPDFDADMVHAVTLDGDVHRHIDVARTPEGRVVSLCLLSGTTRCGFEGSPHRSAAAATCMREPLFERGNPWDQVVDLILSPP